MFLPHSISNKTSHPTSTNSPSKTKKSNDDYITFIRSNHNMIEKHFMNDFEHPYKQSLLKSHGVESDGKRRMSKEEGQQHYNSLFTLEQVPEMAGGKQSVSLKLHQSTNIDKLSRKHEIINSLNFTKPSITNSMTNHALAAPYRYTSTNPPSTKAPFSKQQILSMIQQKNKQISSQLSKQRNNFSQIVYKTKHHSQSNMVKVGSNGKESSEKNRQSIDREGTGSREMRSLQRLRKEENLLEGEKQYVNDGGQDRNTEKTQRVRQLQNNNNHAQRQHQGNVQKFQRYNHNQHTKGKYKLPQHQQPQIIDKNNTITNNNSSNNSNSFILPLIKNRSHSYTNQQQHFSTANKLSQNPSAVVSQYDIITNIYTKTQKPSIVHQSNQQKPPQTQSNNNNLSASINQLRKQFQQNSDAIKMYKKVEKNNIALKVRQINQKNLKSYYQYQNAIIKNTHFYIIEEEQRKNSMTMKQLNSKCAKSNAKILTGDQDYFNTELEDCAINEHQDHHIQRKYQTNMAQSKHPISQKEMFINEIIQNKTNNNIKVFVSKNLSPIKKNIRYLPTPTELQEQLTGRKDDHNTNECNQDQEGEPLIERNSSTLSPSKQRKPQPKNLPLSIIPAVSKAQSTIYDHKVHAYRQFAFKIYFSHKKFYPLIIRQLPSTFMRPEQKFKFFVGKGNNSLLIKSLMKRRFWWTLEQDPKKANFVWTQLKINSLYEYQRKSQAKQLYYKCEDVPVDSSPETMKKTKKKNINKQDQLKERKTFIFKAPLPQDDDMKVFTEFDKKMFNKLSTNLSEMQNPQKLDNFQKRLSYFPQNYLDPLLPQQQKKDISLSNSDESSPYLKNPETSFLKTVRMHNHFEFNHFIGNKKALFYNLRYYYQLINKDVYDIIPLTFHIRNGVKDPQYAKFLKYYKAIEKKSKGQSKAEKQKHDQPQHKPKKQKNIWIIKPGQNSNRGNGIQVFDQLYELNNILKKKDTNKDKTNQPHTYIVQKYIEKPLLYKNRKFDIRHYFVLTRMWGKMKAYFFGQGYIRTASYEFDLGNVGDTEIHLTNDAIQKHCDSYGKYQEGNKLSYVEFQRYLDSVAKQQQSKAYNSNSKKSQSHQKKAISFANDIYPQMRNIAIQAIRGCYIQMDPNKTEHNFQVFGMDFMIDKYYKVWLIEINTNPCLQLSSKLLERVIPTMVQQSLRLTVDIVFPPPYHYPNTMKHMMPDYSLQKLKCQLIFDEDRDGKQLEEMFNKQLEIDKKEGRKSIREMLLGEIDEEDETYDNDGKEINLGEKGGVEVEE